MSSKNIIIITQGLSRIVEPIVDNYNVVGIIESAPRNKSKKNKKLLFSLAKKIYALINPKTKSLTSYANDKNIPYFFMDSGSSKSLENWVREKNPDMIVIYSMSQLLKRNIFDIPKYRTINLHPSLLPKYKGPNPWFWNYYNMESKGGVTLHYIDDDEDTGEIIYQEEYDIPLGLKSPVMQDLAIGKLGIGLILKALDNIENLTGRLQSSEISTKRARNIIDNEHMNIIDWETWKIERIWHLLRGTELWLNAFEQPKGIYKGQRWIIEDYQHIPTQNYIVGQVFKEDNRHFVVCNEGKVFLTLTFSMKKFLLNLIR